LRRDDVQSLVDPRQRLELVEGRRAGQGPFQRGRAFAPVIAGAFLPANSDQKTLTKKITMLDAMIM
jgi:hypothetical protein